MTCLHQYDQQFLPAKVMATTVSNSDALLHWIYKHVFANKTEISFLPHQDVDKVLCYYWQPKSAGIVKGRKKLRSGSTEKK